MLGSRGTLAFPGVLLAGVRRQPREADHNYPGPSGLAADAGERGGLHGQGSPTKEPNHHLA